ncbi:cytochrome b [Serratia sp. S1B]|nr:cytochrome b [Serratia sp. S1B]
MDDRYAKSQIIFHWLTLVMVILTYTAMLLKDSVPDEYVALVKQLHFNFGISVFVLMFIRLGLRHVHKAPPITPPLEPLQALGAAVFHWALYLLFLVLPLLGMLSVVYGGKDLILLGWQVPQLVSPNPQTGHFLKEIHELLANTGYFIIGIHALAALYHHYFRGDNTLRRMMPGK